jgi:pimeloyl-ACP methyl ester carboxylesterase
MQANGLTAPIARLLVERGVVAVDGGWTWSSDARLTLPTMVRMSEAQIGELVAGITCPTRVIFADPPQPYLPGPVRSARARLLPDGDCVVVAGSHHVHMEDPLAVAEAIGGFLRD